MRSYTETAPQDTASYAVSCWHSHVLFCNAIVGLMLGMAAFRCFLAWLCFIHNLELVTQCYINRTSKVIYMYKVKRGPGGFILNRFTATQSLLYLLMQKKENQLP